MVFLRISVLCGLFLFTKSTIYKPNWESLDHRPLPLWFDEAKFGIFNHWGLYSAHGIKAWFWYYWKVDKYKEQVEYMEKNYRPDFTYADFGRDFKTEFFDPEQFAKLIKKSGAKYYVLTSKHHEGYTLWPSNYSWNWNSVDLGPKRDLVGELRDAFEKLGGVHYGLYFSQFEFFNPLYLDDKAHSFKDQNYVEMVSQPQLQEIVNSYKPEVIWSDGDWEASPEYWNSTNFLAWLYNSSPVKDTVVTNDRWGKGTECKHGGYYSCQDQYDPGVLLPHKWESASIMDHGMENNGWAWRHSMRAEDVMNISSILSLLARTVSCGGNLLLNVGPTGYGRIQPIFEERLTEIGHWLTINGEAIYETKPWIYQNDSISSFVWYTSKMRQNQGLKKERVFNPQLENQTVVYAIVTEWPEIGMLSLGSAHPTNQTKVGMIGYNYPITFEPYEDGLLISLNLIPWQGLPSLHTWVIKLEYLADENRDPLNDINK